ncbi:hypothetical protein QYF61_015553 [Mycteria americana]|uniref:RING-type domain-containing protein n=1 Tax=Mycteria americana TaxID=33587 RepID=A0AAN7RWQ4_MYCAM|nr:hypothetical protein QYF61_015553 [Mycteria americana]
MAAAATSCPGGLGRGCLLAVTAAAVGRGRSRGEELLPQRLLLVLPKTDHTPGAHGRQSSPRQRGGEGGLAAREALLNAAPQQAFHPPGSALAKDGLITDALKLNFHVVKLKDVESLQIWQPSNHSDFSCPICLQTATLPVETNCGHLFCGSLLNALIPTAGLAEENWSSRSDEAETAREGSCLITYWKHSPWLAAITCPLCRQKVVLLDNVSCEKQQDKPSKQVVQDIRDYNKCFSGQPRPVLPNSNRPHWLCTFLTLESQLVQRHYLYDMPLFLTLALRGIFTWGGLVWIFFLRVAVCSFGTIICLSSPFDMKPGPLCRTLGTADDMVVVSLLLICMINICQQIASNGDQSPVCCQSPVPTQTSDFEF